MRIPPAVAQQIGQLFAVARGADTASARLESAVRRADSANAHIGAGRFDAARADAIEAQRLLDSVARTDSGTPDAIRHLTLPIAELAPAIITELSATPPRSPINLIADMSGRAGHVAEQAGDLAAWTRAEADELASQYL